MAEGRFTIEPAFGQAVPESIVVIGGTFDPPHRAHIAFAQAACAHCGSSCMVFVPARCSPHKAQERTAGHHRLAMLRLAVAEVPGAHISTFELDRPATSYTVVTLEAMREAVGESVRLHLLIGADQAVSFERWYRWERILEIAEPVIAVRAGSDDGLDAVLRKHPEWAGCVMPVAKVDISSTEIREGLRAGGDVGNRLHPAVLRYVLAHGLYGSSASSQ